MPSTAEMFSVILRCYGYNHPISFGIEYINLYVLPSASASGASLSPSTSATSSLSAPFAPLSSTSTVSMTSSSSSSIQPVRTGPSCPSADGTTFTETDGSEFLILCNSDYSPFIGEYSPDMPQSPQAADSLVSCMDLCTNNGTLCMGVVWQAANNQCNLQTSMAVAQPGRSRSGYVASALRQSGPASGGVPQQVISNGEFSGPGLTPWPWSVDQNGNDDFRNVNGAAFVQFPETYVGVNLMQPISVPAGQSWFLSAHIDVTMDNNTNCVMNIQTDGQAVWSYGFDFQDQHKYINASGYVYPYATATQIYMGMWCQAITRDTYSPFSASLAFDRIGLWVFPQPSGTSSTIAQPTSTLPSSTSMSPGGTTSEMSTSSSTDTSSAASSSSTSAQPVGPLCPDSDGTTYTETDGSTYLIVANLAYVPDPNDSWWSAPPFDPQTATCLGSCIDLCMSQGTHCMGVTWQPSSNDCRMKTAMNNPQPNASVYIHSALRMSGPASAGAPQQIVLDGRFDNAGLTPWVSSTNQPSWAGTSRAIFQNVNGKGVCTGTSDGVAYSADLQQPLAIPAGQPFFLSAYVDLTMNADNWCEVSFGSQSQTYWSYGFQGQSQYHYINASGIVISSYQSPDIEVRLKCGKTTQTGLVVTSFGVDNVGLWIYSPANATTTISAPVGPPTQILRNPDFANGNLTPWVGQSLLVGSGVIYPIFSVVPGHGGNLAQVGFPPGSYAGDLPTQISQDAAAKAGQTYTFTADIWTQNPGAAVCDINVYYGYDIFFSNHAVAGSQYFHIDISGVITHDTTYIQLLADCMLYGTSSQDSSYDIQVLWGNLYLWLNTSPPGSSTSSTMGQPTSTSPSTSSSTRRSTTTSSSSSSAQPTNTPCLYGYGTEIVVADGTRYLMVCGVDYEVQQDMSGNPNGMGVQPASNLASCFDLCTSYGIMCMGVTWDARFHQCTLNTGMTPVNYQRPGYEVDSAIRMSGPTSMAAPKQVIANGSFDGVGLGAWASYTADPQGPTFANVNGTAFVRFPVPSGPNDNGQGSTVTIEQNVGIHDGQQWFFSAYINVTTDPTNTDTACYLQFQIQGRTLWMENLGGQSQHHHINGSGFERYGSPGTRIVPFFTCMGSSPASIALDDIALYVFPPPTYSPTPLAQPTQVIQNPAFGTGSWDPWTPSFPPQGSTASMEISLSNGRAQVSFPPNSDPDGDLAGIVQNYLGIEAGYAYTFTADIWFSISRAGPTCQVTISTEYETIWSMQHVTATQNVHVNTNGSFEWPASQLILLTSCVGAQQATVQFDIIYLTSKNP